MNLERLEAQCRDPVWYRVAARIWDMVRASVGDLVVSVVGATARRVRHRIEDRVRREGNR